MRTRGLSQEGLKLIACVTMLLDHVGAVLVIALFYRNPSAFLLGAYDALRFIGRLSFPIYCFLLAEGSAHTRNPFRYGLRLAVCALITEIPYDYAFWGGMDWQHQNVMMTLLVGFCGLEAMKKCSNIWWKLLVAVPFVLLGKLVRGDYMGQGILLIFLFGLTREIPHKGSVQFLGMWFIFSPNHAMMLNWLSRFSISLQEWAVLALIPIHLYTGEKRTASRWVQWAFYLFYPVHLTVLWICSNCLQG